MDDEEEISTYIHTYIHTDIRTDIHTDKHTDEAGSRGAFAPKNWTMMKLNHGTRILILYPCSMN